MHIWLAALALSTTLHDAKIVLQAGQTSVPEQIVFSPTAHIFATATYGGTGVRIYDADSRLLVRVIPGKANLVAFSPDGTQIAVFANYRTTIFDVETGKSLANGYTDSDARTISFSAAGKRVLYAGRDVYSWTIGAERGARAGKLECNNVWWRRGTDQVLCEQNGAYSMFDFATAAATPATPAVPPNASSAYNGDGSRFVVVRDRQAHVLDGATFAKIASVPLPEQPKGTEAAQVLLQLPQKENTALVGAGEKLLRIDLSSGKLTSTIDWVTPLGADALLQSAGVWMRSDNHDRKHGKLSAVSADGMFILETGQSGAFYPRESHSGVITGSFGSKGYVLASKLRFTEDGQLRMTSSQLRRGNDDIYRQFDLYTARELELLPWYEQTQKAISKTGEWSIVRPPGRQGCQLFKVATKTIVPHAWNTVAQTGFYSYTAEDQFCEFHHAFGKNLLVVAREKADVYDVRKLQKLASVPVPKDSTCLVNDGETHVACGSKTSTVLFAVKNGAVLATIPARPLGFAGALLLTADENQVQAWDTATGAEKKGSKPLATRASDWTLTADGSVLVVSGSILGGEGWAWDFKTNEVRKLPYLGNRILLSKDDKTLISADPAGDVLLHDFPSGAIRKRLPGHVGWIKLQLSPDGSRLLSTGDYDHRSILWDLQKAEEIVSIEMHADDYVILTPDNYYMGHGGAVEQIGLRLGNRAYPIGIFDLALNRPDIVLARMGKAPKETIELFEQSHGRRLEKMGLTSIDLGAPLPQIALSAAVPALAKSKLDVPFEATSAAGLARVQVEINGVPVQTVSLAGAPKSHKQSLSLLLSAGANVIKLRAVDTKGSQSTPVQLLVLNQAPAKKPTLYAIAIGVSQYRAADYTLRYAAKDAQDLLATLQTDTSTYAAVKVLPILDSDATLEGIAKATAFLEPAGIDDVVLLFAAGHGLLDDRARYYFATHDIDFDKPAERGLPFERLEALLAATPARHRLILMDTCSSGETDEEEVARKAQTPHKGVVAARGLKRKSTTISVSSDAGLLISRDLFANVRDTSGASVIASSSGVEYSFESDQLKNGIFTYALLKALREGNVNTAAGDDMHHVDDLRTYVTRQVEELTKGAQHPTARQRNGEDDFAVFKVNHAPRPVPKKKKK